jgi:hypothetical protein
MIIFHDVSGDVERSDAYQIGWISSALRKYPGLVVIRRTVNMDFEAGHFAAIDEADGVVAEFNRTDNELQERIIYANMVGKRVMVIVPDRRKPYRLLDRFPTPSPISEHSKQPARTYSIKDDSYGTPWVSVFGGHFNQTDRLNNWLSGFSVATEEEAAERYA